MLRLVFCLLFIANGILLANQLGWLGNYINDTNNSRVVLKQGDKEKTATPYEEFNPQQAKLMTNVEVQVALDKVPAKTEAELEVEANMAANTVSNTANAAPNPVPNTPPIENVSKACYEVGNFSQQEADTVYEQLRQWQFQNRLKRSTVRETAHNMVYLGSLGSKEAAEKKTEQLRKLGITDFSIIQDSQPKWGISLGVFKTADAAKAYMRELMRKGVSDTKMQERSVSSTKIMFRINEVTTDEKKKIEQIKQNHKVAEIRACS